MLQRIRSAWNELAFPAWTAPLGLLLAVVAAYGLRLSLVGFYWDDWPYLWFYHLLGPAGMTATLGADRPLLAVLYSLTMALLGDHPLAWQIFALLLRWLCALGFWLALRQAWPRQNGPFFAALLFAVFPGFTQHWISVVWGNAYVLYAFVFFSLALTTWAARRQRRLAWALPLGLALSGFTLFSTEYFFGLEMLRPILTWLALRRDGLAPRPRWKRALLSWLPFLAMMVAFALWRALVHPFGGGGQEGLMSGLINSPLRVLSRLPVRIASDLFQTLVSSWGQAFAFGPLDEKAGQLYALLVVLAGGLAWLYLARLRAAPGTQAEEAPPSWSLEAGLLGLFTLLVSGMPFWITSLPLRLTFPWDRFFLVLAPGAALALAALASWVAHTPGRRALLLGLLIGAAIGFQNTSAAVFRNDWGDERDFFWQLAWRAPAVQPGTLFLIDQIGFAYMEDDSLSGPLNWTLDPNPPAARMNYAIYNIPERLNLLGGLEPNYTASKDYRALTFTGNTSQVVVVRYNPPGCLQILDPARDQLRSDLPQFALRALPLSRPELILAAPPEGSAPSAPPQDIFGAEPRRKWCYYYEQAALALQAGNWKRIAALRQQSIGEGYFPADPAEYLPFVEAFLHLYRWDDALELSNRAYYSDSATAPALCQLWKQVQSSPAATLDFRTRWKVASENFNCKE